LTFCEKSGKKYKSIKTHAFADTRNNIVETVLLNGIHMMSSKFERKLKKERKVDDLFRNERRYQIEDDENIAMYMVAKSEIKKKTQIDSTCTPTMIKSMKKNKNKSRISTKNMK
jgi:hypothetical protein